MNIRISTEALTGSDDGLLWSGALYGLQRLAQLDHQLFFAAGDLSARQQVLLENENLSPCNSDAEEHHLQVTAENNRLKAISNGSEIEIADNWIALSNRICLPTRKASMERDTLETDIFMAVNLDGTGQSNISTGVGFFDHMLEQIAKHGLIDLEVQCEGDLEVDEHHTIEDVAITLGNVLTDALGDKIGIQRYGVSLPMDESLANVSIDLSGRPYLVFNGQFDREMVGDFPTEMVEHFFYSLAVHLQATMHISVKGANDHHKIEACFKAFARCFRAAVSRSERGADVLPSTKDLL